MDENGKIIEEILFDRIADPYQLSNKLTDHPQEATQLKEQLIEFLKELLAKNKIDAK